MPQLDHRFMNAHLVTRRGQAVVAIGAREYSVMEAAKLCGLPFGTLRSRLRAGWSIADAMTKPVVPIPGRRPGND
jgi:DNA-directed RNA polymerase specialized sigma24 family protein